MKSKFTAYAASDSIENNIYTQRVGPVEVRTQDFRTEFDRDYTRILHSTAYRRLKHKTQVFFNVRNDHICTRMEHVAHVESVSTSIAKKLGLNVALTKAIAMGHDLGHAPFGHKGEEVISRLTQEYLHKKFWHEQNGLYFVDNIELLPNSAGVLCNLNLTNGVWDILKYDLKIYLVKNGYPPQYSPEVFNKAMEQVENFEEYNG